MSCCCGGKQAEDTERRAAEEIDTERRAAEALACHAASSSAEGGLDVKKKIQTGAAVEEENVDVDLDVLIGNISDLLELIKENSSHQKPSIQDWPITSSGLLKLKDFLSEGIKCTSVREDNITDRYPSFTKTIVRSLMKNIGHTHCVTAGLLVVADILQRFETVSANRNECLPLLEEMNRLAKFLKELKERLPPTEGMENTIDAATDLIVGASIMCCTQIDSYKFSSFFSSPINKEELGRFEQQLRDMYKLLVTVVNRRAYPEYAVGIKSSVNEVIDLLEWESQNNAVAVILQGPEGMGKTTLAHAVFSCIDIQGSKNAIIKVVEKIDSTPKIIALQKSILNDIMEPEEPIPDIRKYEEGQRELSVMLQRVPAFIFIDNVMCPDDLQLLLPKDMKKAKKLRLLLTTCDINVRRACRIKTKVYAMKSLADSDAKHLLEKEMSDGTERGNQLNDGQLQKLLEICGGVPKRLTLVAGIIRCAENKHNAFMKVIEENGERWQLL